jgi:hypothetical protein
MGNIERITSGLKNGEYTSNPHQCANDLSILAGEYSWVCGQLEAVLQKKPQVWNILRVQHKSDTSAERTWQSTPDGINEMGLRLRMKGIEKMMSALKSLIRVAEGEAHNLH